MKLPKNLLVNDSKTINGISCLSSDFNNIQKKRVKCKVNSSKFQKLITFRFWSLMTMKPKEIAHSHVFLFSQVATGTSSHKTAARTARKGAETGAAEARTGSREASQRTAASSSQRER